MVKLLRSVLAIFTGLVVGFLAIVIGVIIELVICPVSARMDIDNLETIPAAMEAMPAAAKVVVPIAWAVGTFGGAWVAAKIAAVGRIWHGLAIGVCFLAFIVPNSLVIPYPLWLRVVRLVELLPAAYMGAWLASRKRSAPPGAA